MKKAAIGWVMVLIGAALLWWALRPKTAVPAPVHPAVPVLTIGTADISVEIADSDALREEGLSGRTSLAENAGMLFVFPEPEKPGFWMKDMNFPLDIVWIAPDWTIEGVDKSLSPATYPKVFAPSSPIQYVLEIPAGYFDRHGFRIGEAVSKNF